MSEELKIVINGDATKAKAALSDVDKSVKVLAKSSKVAFVAMGAAAAAFTGFAVKRTLEFNAAISDLSAITGATGKDLKFLEAQAKSFGSTTTLSATQAAEAFKLIASAKPDLLNNAAALSEVTGEVIKLSEASGVDLAFAADAVGASLNQFGAEADQAGRFVNVLAAGAKLGSSAVNDTALALENAGTVAAGAGLSFEQTNAAIQMLAKVGIKGAKAGVGLRGVLLKLSTQSRDEFNPEIVGLTTALHNLNKANLSTTEKSKLFGQESITAANALMQEAGSLDSLTAAMTGTNTATEQAATRIDNLAGDLKGLESVTEGVAIVFGQSLAPSLRVIVQGFIELVRVEEKSTSAMQSAERSAEQLSILMGQVADVAGNAARGIALPFEAVGGAIGALMGQIVAVMDGNFSDANRIGQAWADDMVQNFDKMTDPAIAERYERIALRMAAANEKARNAISSGGGNDDTGTEEGTDTGTDTGGEALRIENIINMHAAKYQALAEMAMEADLLTEERELLKLDQELIAMGEERARLLEQKQWTDDLEEQFDAAKINRAQVTANRLVKVEEDRINKQLDMEKTAAKAKQKFMDDLSSLMNSKSRAMFELGKTVAISNAVISGGSAAVSAWESGMDMPGPWAPAFAVAFAAASLAKTGMMIQSIRSTQFGSTSAGVAAGGGIPNVGGGGGIPASPQVPQAPEPTVAAPTQSVSITLNSGLYDANAVRDLIDSINEQTGDGVSLNARIAA